MAVCPAACLLRARDVASGVAIARTARPDVILMGVQLIAPNGLQARLLLARDPATAHIPLIALGLDGEAIEAGAPVPAGFAGHLSMPLQSTAFINALDLAFQPQQAGGLHATA